MATEVQDERGRSACHTKMERLRDKCATWAQNRGQFACCARIASQGWSNCLSGINYWPPMPWDNPDGELCAKGLYLEG